MPSDPRPVKYRQTATIIAWTLLLSFLVLVPFHAEAAEKPKVRAVTAFVRLERAQYRDQVRETLKFLRGAKESFEAEGYEVQSVRITTQPFLDYLRGLSDQEVLAFFRDWAEFDPEENYLAAIGPAKVEDAREGHLASLLAGILRHNWINASLVVADENGVRWEAVREAAHVIKYLAENSPGGIANFNFAATAMVPPEIPFYPGSYHLGPGRRFAVALQSANVVAEALASSRDPQKAGDALATGLGSHARAIEAVARRIEKDTGWEYLGIDLSPAPLKEVSIGGAIEGFTGAKFGSSGTMTAATLITGVLQELPVKRAGYSGLMVPVLEDSVLAERWSEGTLTLDALLAYSAVCGTGVDAVPLPGDVTVEQLERIIGDMASLAFRLRKPLSARLLPVPGKKPGDRTEFRDPFLVNAVIQRVP